jgi:hypothetical protein
MNRKREQAEMFAEFGQLFGPLLRVKDSPESYDSDERTRILARFNHDYIIFIRIFNDFAQGEPGHHYQAQYNRMHNVLQFFVKHQIEFTAGLIAEEALFGMVTRTYNDGFDAIAAIPIPIESAIHEAHTPFSTYCLVKDLCSTARRQVVWMDRYFDQAIFRYFVEMPKATEVVLVTWPESKCTGKRDQQRYADFMGVSNSTVTDFS